MQHEQSRIEVLRNEIVAALGRLVPPCSLADEPAFRLANYAHEIAFPASTAGNQPPATPTHPRVDGWSVTVEPSDAGARARRHYLVAEVDLGTTADWFPLLLGKASRLRSHLDQDEQADVAILVVATPGTAPQGTIAKLERNEAFAQVLVWSPGTNPQTWQLEAQQFASRLRLGPVELPSERDGVDLSPMDAVLRGVTLDPQIAERWRGILADSSVSPRERATLLLAAADAAESGGNRGE